MRIDHEVALVVQNADVRLDLNNATIYPKNTDHVTRGGGEGPNRTDEIFVLGPQFRLEFIEGFVEVRGNFSLNLIEWDVILDHPGGHEKLWSGKRYEAVAPATQVGPTLRPAEPRELGSTMEYQSIYAFVTNGYLRMEVRADDNQITSMGSAEGFTTADISLTSDMLGNPDLQGLGATLGDKLDGARVVSLQAPQVNQLLGAFPLYQMPTASAPSSETPKEETTEPSTEPAKPLPDSTVPVQSTSSPAPALPDAGLPLWLWMLLVPAALMVFAVLRIFIPIHRIHKLEDAYDLSLYAFVLDRAPQLFGSRRFGARASLMFTVATLEKKGPEAAEQHLSRSRARNLPTGATLDYLMARIRADQTRFDEARTHVRACIRAEPAFIMEIKRNPTLEFLSHAPSDPGEGYV